VRGRRRSNYGRIRDLGARGAWRKHVCAAEFAENNEACGGDSDFAAARVLGNALEDDVYAKVRETMGAVEGAVSRGLGLQDGSTTRRCS